MIFFSDSKDDNIKIIYETMNATTIIHLNHYMVAFRSLTEKPLVMDFKIMKEPLMNLQKKIKW